MLEAVLKEAMITLSFPDGSQREYPEGISGFEIAKNLSQSLSKAAVLMKFNGTLRDLSTQLTTNGTIEILTITHPEALETLRHDAAHVIAEAVKELFPETQITIGPAIENGFYYDFYRETSFTPEDLLKIEERMRDIVKRDEKLSREVWPRNKAIDFFEKEGEKFKADIIRDLPEHEDISLYRQGNFIDLCRGPHFPSTSKVGTAFKLTKLAGAYWRGDPKNPQLQRIYGTVWPSQKELDDYLHQIEEAEKRDHRRLGREMSLFHMQEEGPGVVFWHPKGWTIFTLLQTYIRHRLKEADYKEINTPQLLDKAFWVASGHWDKFQEHMFISEVEHKTFAVKPMSCPGAIQIFKQGLKSYRDLPLRLSEFGLCHRNEASGALHGLLRVRAMTQDDAHIFCTPEQITSETKKFCALLAKVYEDMGFPSPRIKFSDRPETRAGSDEVWDQAENALKTAIEDVGLDYTLNPGEGAFYGPKLEFVLKDAIGRDWQLGTLQVDFILPERLGATYIGEDGKKHVPVLLHRAILGSLERFIGVLIEQYAGKFPLWLSPCQVMVTSLTSVEDDAARIVYHALQHKGIRAELDLRNEKINYKIREHSLAKMPYIFVIGKKEAAEKTVAIRKLGSTAQEILALDVAIERIYIESQPPYVNN